MYVCIYVAAMTAGHFKDKYVLLMYVCAYCTYDVLFPWCATFGLSSAGCLEQHDPSGHQDPSPRLHVCQGFP